MTFSPEVWDGVVRRLRPEVPDFVHKAFIQTLAVETRGDAVRISCRSAFHRDRIRSLWLGTIRDCIAKEMGRAVELELVVHEATDSVPVKPRPTPRPSPQAVPKPEPTPRAAPMPAQAPRTLTPPIQRPLLRPPLTFDSFVVGPCNSLAREASLAVVRDEEPHLSQLYLYGGPGLGKTHLARAICSEARANGKRPVYTTAEAFLNEFLASMRSRQTGSFKKKFRQECDVLVVEDVGFLEGKQSTQLEFFHTVQHLQDADKRIVFTGSRLPQSLTALEPRLRSQLTQGFVAEMGTPDAQVRRAILRAKADAGGVHLPDESLEMLVERVRGSVRDLVSVLGQLVATASLLQKRIDRTLTEEALAKKGASGPGSLPHLEIADVVKLVAKSFKTTQAKMSGKSRRKQVLVPRQLAMYLCCRYTDASLADIGRAFERDHPSVRNAITKIERAILEKAPLRYQVEALVEQLDRVRGLT